MDSKTKEALKLMQGELRAVQLALESFKLQGGAIPEFVDTTVSPSGKLSNKLEAKALTELLQPINDEHIDLPDAAVVYSVLVRPAGGTTPKLFSPAGLPLSRLKSVSEESVASVAAALSAPPKIAILRTLFSLPGGKETAANLGEKTGLSSGSLYYHLRDLDHASLIEQAVRGSYTITTKGICGLLLMSALALD
jgi:DNA-binding transcriptional ArsR family regulator